MVVIWNMAPVRSKSDETNSNVPKRLCELTNHLSCVNSVCWSRDGKWLASGGDDAIVMIWQIRHQGIMSSGFGSTTHEHWGCVHMLRGHASDVLDLSWSPDHKYLASCSVDNTIVIWNAKDLPQKLSVITGHQGMVKGVTWDPVGKFVATQSDDRSIKIWRISDWKEVKMITEPFKKCGGTTHVLRLSWSPDGKFIISAHALNNDGPTAQIIERGAEWKAGMDFVGHRKAVEVVLFNPHLFVKSDSKDNHGCVAIGSRDRSLSVWLTNLKRPLLVLHDLFDDSILDLSWSADGYELLVCSIDGSIAYLSFSSKELGLRLSKQALDDLYLRTYGTKGATVKNDDSSTILIENPEMLKLHSSMEDKITSGNSFLSEQKGAVNQSVGMISTSAKTSTITKQVETITKEGRRRITPITLTTEPSSISEAPLPFTSFSPKQNKGAVVHTTPEKNLTKKNTSGSENSTPKSTTDYPENIAPPKPIQFQPLSPQKLQDSVILKDDTKSPSKGTSSIGVGQKRNVGETSGGILTLPKAKKLKKRVHLSTASSITGSPKMNTPQKQSNISLLKQSSTLQLAIPKLEPSISIMLLNVTEKETAPVIEVDNESHNSQYFLSYLKGPKRIWRVLFNSPCLLASANEHITCIACVDKSLSIYSTKTGRLLVSKLYLHETCYCLKIESHFLMVVVCSCQISVWDTQNMKAILTNVPFSHLLSKKSPDECLLTRDGLPVLKIGSSGFIFNLGIHSWMELVDSEEISGIQRLNFNYSSPSQENAPLDALQKSFQTTTRSDSVGIMLQQVRTVGSQSSSTVKYLENQISRSLCLKSPLEYKQWCKTYVQFLVKENLEERLREFCGEFSSPKGHDEMILGLSKFNLLQEMLSIVAKNTKFQRLYSELKDTLDSMDNIRMSL